MKRSSHIALVPFPAQGHVPPMLHLARKLAANGFIVTLINIDSIHRKLLQEWNSPPPHLDIRLREVTCDLQMPHGFTSDDVKDLRSGMASIERLEDGVEKLLQSLEPRPCCLVADFFMCWSSRVAKSLGMCPVTYWPGNATWSWLQLHFRLLDSRGDVFQDEKNEHHQINYIPGIDSLNFDELPDYFIRSRTEPHHFLLALNQDQFKDSQWTLVNSMMELEPPPFQAMQDSLGSTNFVPVGPLFPLSELANPLAETRGSLRNEDKECLSWLDTQAERSVLYISFGSIGTLSGGAFEELTAGLEASGQPFLWVTRMDLVEESKDKFQEFVKRTKKQGLTVPWAPQLRVLSHGSVGGFLSHCGWNSTLESICHGVPILGWPLFFEQRLNCKLVAENWGVGKWFSKQLQIGREQVEEKIRDFMHGEEMGEIRARVKKLKDIAKRTASEGGISHTNLEKFMTGMKGI